MPAAAKSAHEANELYTWLFKMSPSRKILNHDVFVSFLYRNMLHASAKLPQAEIELRMPGKTNSDGAASASPMFVAPRKQASAAASLPKASNGKGQAPTLESFLVSPPTPSPVQSRPVTSSQASGNPYKKPNSFAQVGKDGSSLKDTATPAMRLGGQALSSSAVREDGRAKQAGTGSVKRSLYSSVENNDTAM
jgi:hypothetical protein